MSRRARALLLLVLVMGLAGCDQVTKGLAARGLVDGPKTLISGLLELRYSENTGVAFSLLRDVAPETRRPLVLGLQLLAVGFLVLLCWRRRLPGWPARLGCAAIAAGALGNLVDRVARGGVIDFIHVRGWPIFNVADILIVAGVGLLALSTLRRRPQPAS